MELKVICPCGQKYKFDVEPVNGQMPFAVNCPICGLDGTPLANNLLVQMPGPLAAPIGAAPPVAVAAAPVAAMAAPVAASAAPSQLRLNRQTAPPPAAPPIPPMATAGAAPAAPRGRPTPGAYAPAPAVPKYMRDNPALQNNNLLMGILGGVIGAVVAVVVVFGAAQFGGLAALMFMRLMWGIPLGIIMGAVIGCGARILYHGTDFQLGALCAGIAFFAIGLTFVFVFGLFGMVFGLFGLIFGISTAFKVAS